MVTKTIFSLLIILTTLWAGDKNPIPWGGRENLKLENASFDDTVAMAFKEAQEEFSVENNRQKKPALAFGMSLILPGAGQFYNGNYWRTALYSGFEILGWTMAAIYNDKGDQEDAIFRKYADQHWDEVIYWAKVYQLGRNNNGVIPDAGQGWDINEPSSPGTLPEWISRGFYDYYMHNVVFQDNLRESENDVANYFTHSLPLTKTQQYYEMIGKYSSQFGNAWNDADFNKKYLYGAGSPNNKEYYEMRNLSNDYYDIAGNWLSAIMINHLVSGLDALWSAKSYNKSLSVSYRPRFFEGKLINSYAINLKF